MRSDLKMLKRGLQSPLCRGFVLASLLHLFGKRLTNDVNALSFLTAQT